MFISQPHENTEALIRTNKEHKPTSSKHSQDNPLHTPLAVSRVIEGGKHSGGDKPANPFASKTSDSRQDYGTDSRYHKAHTAHSALYRVKRGQSTAMYRKSSRKAPRKSIGLFVSDEQLDIFAIGAFQSMLAINSFLPEMQFANLSFSGSSNPRRYHSIWSREQVLQHFGHALVRGLQHNKSLQKLTLRNCSLTDEIVIAFAQQVLSKPENKLTYLDLSENPNLGHEGIIAIFRALEQRQSESGSTLLTTLCLRATGLTTATVQKIASCYLSSSQLRHLSLASADLLLPPGVWLILAHAVQQNFNLQSLTVGVQDLSKPSRDDLRLLDWTEPTFSDTIGRLRYYIRRNQCRHITSVQNAQKRVKLQAKISLSRSKQELRENSLTTLHDWIRHHPQVSW